MKREYNIIIIILIAFIWNFFFLDEESVREKNVPKTLYGKPSKQFDSSEKRALWWSNLDNKWKASFNKLLFNSTETASRIPADEDIIYLMNTKKMIFSSEHMTSLLDDFSGLTHLTNLESITFSMQSFKSFRSMPYLENLRYFDSYMSGISNFHGIDNIRQLDTLNLNANNLASLEGIEQLTQLKYLNVKKNEITSFKGIEKLTTLNYLDCSMNPIQSSEIMRLSDLKNLEVLIVRHIKLSVNDLDSLIPNLNLKKLFISRKLYSSNELSLISQTAKKYDIKLFRR